MSNTIASRCILIFTAFLAINSFRSTGRPINLAYRPVFQPTLSRQQHCPISCSRITEHLLSTDRNPARTRRHATQSSPRSQSRPTEPQPLHPGVHPPMVGRNRKTRSHAHQRPPSPPRITALTQPASLSILIPHLKTRHPHRRHTVLLQHHRKGPQRSQVAPRPQRDARAAVPRARQARHGTWQRGRAGQPRARPQAQAEEA